MSDTFALQSVEWLKKCGYEAGIVERRHPHLKTRHDLFGFVDVAAYLLPDALTLSSTQLAWLAGDALNEREQREIGDGCDYRGTLYVQASSHSAMSTHQNKVTDSVVLTKRLEDLLAVGNRFEIWGFVRGRRRPKSVRRYVLDRKGYLWYWNTSETEAFQSL